jgi:hypothetical protein
MRIKNNSGQFWTGTCWGVEQAAEFYRDVPGLPLFLGYLEREIHNDDPRALDIRYYEKAALEAEASVVK